MKKIIIPILAATALTASAAVHAETIGTVLSTDIGTVIDGAACKTYNVAGSTFVVAEDLRGYGFDVDWDESARLLTITQNPYAQRTLLTAADVNIEKADCTIGEPLMDILATDIKVIIAGEEAEGYNIDGYMVIPVRALEPYAYVEYDDEKRLVKIKGLQHYLDERYNSGNPNVTQAVREYSQKTNNWSYPLGTSNVDFDREGIIEYVDVKEVTTKDIENGNIYSYYGNPLALFTPTELYHFERCYDREIYSIENKNGEQMYDADLLYSQRNSYEDTHIITNNYAQIINQSEDFLYGYSIHDEREHTNYWPSDEEINSSDIRFEKFFEKDVLAENGFLYTITSYQDENRHLTRYNMASSNVSRDNVLYDFSTYFSSEKRNSMFDKIIAYDVKKAIGKNCILNTSNELVYEGNVLFENVKDAMNVYDGKLCVLTVDGELYMGSYDEFADGSPRKLADWINGIYQSGSIVYFINDNYELYSYNVTKKYKTKLADNISKVVTNDLYITTEGVLTNLKKEYATEVKDAYEYGAVVYIIKTDGTLWYYKTGELARVKAFE